MWKALFLASFLLGAAGDLIYEAHVTTEITANEAAGLADNFISVDAWDGNRARIISCTVERSTDSTTGFRAFCIGKKSASAASLPLGVVVVDRE
jgi:hypothetical protein